MELGAIAAITGAIIAFVAVPGFMLTMAIFPKKEDLDPAERAGLSTILGLTPVVLLYFLDKNFSVPINAYTTLSAFAAVTLAGLAGWQYRKRK